MDRKKEADLCNLALDQSQTEVTELGKDLDNKNQQLQSWYRNPFFMVALGALTGIAVSGGLHR